jgi:GDPmannose 4,6-dehydratase
LKRALITGVTGQDGAYLASLLSGKGYTVFGTYLPGERTEAAPLHEIGCEKQVHLLPLDLSVYENVLAVVEEVKPDEVYNLAAQSSVASAFDDALLTADIDALGPLRVLDVLKKRCPWARFFQASSSQMFGNAGIVPQCETTPFRPTGPYGTAKLFAHWTAVNFREAHGMFACSGVLFNHESPLRGRDFVTRKVSDAVARISAGKLDCLHLGYIDARRDWGYARDYVEAMWLMLQQDTPDDYVIATGEAHTVREFVEIAFDTVGITLEWAGSGIEERGINRKSGGIIVELSPDLFRPVEVQRLVGDASRARNRLGWRPQVTFRELVHMMVEADLGRLQAATAKEGPDS